ncbi:hypothetical protein I4F81_011368 [Pyropia yezoensis]|uniref:Uncharacterized protein n=1 Tax=Pyropia yezoensis TaxID=2788 RepID=A0ACC3CFW5_PYRYE|nr:hypothetical protein I4F81_011368 [Neopyropia yezoensis]
MGTLAGGTARPPRLGMGVVAKVDHRNDHGHDENGPPGHKHPNKNNGDGSDDRRQRLANHGWDRSWRSGRATWYGGRDDPTMDEDEGSCLNQGYIPRPVHAYYSAPSDISVFYPDARCQYPNPHGWWYAPLCPRTRRTCRDVCMQLRCKAKYNTWSQLAYGKHVEAEMCRRHKSVVVQFTDTCPANHPQNVTKKHNWCAAGQGGEHHIDISWTAWDTIVRKRDVGVVHMEWRVVDCSVGVGEKGWDQDVYKDVWQG